MSRFNIQRKNNHSGFPVQQESEFVALLQAGDREAFARLYDDYDAALNGVISRVLQDRYAAEDALQDVFTRIWKHIGMYDPSKGRLFTWMVNIARNHAIDVTRSKAYRKSRLVAGSEELLAAYPDPSLRSKWADTLDVRTLTQGLAEDDRLLLDLVYLGGYTQAELAVLLQRPLGTIKSRIRRILQDLRKLYDKDDRVQQAA